MCNNMQHFWRFEDFSLPADGCDCVCVGEVFWVGVGLVRWRGFGVGRGLLGVFLSFLYTHVLTFDFCF